jgi:hypothetical protein
LGKTLTCISGTDIYSAELSLNSNPDIGWYKGTGSPTPSTDFDVWGVATHEFGNATGTWGSNNHFQNGDPGIICDLS